MPEIVWKHYVGRGPEVEAYLIRWRQAEAEVKAARRALMEEYGASGVLPDTSRKGGVAGLLFWEKPDSTAVTSRLADGKTADGRSYYVAFPNMRTMEGKELARKLQSPALSMGQDLVVLMGLSCIADFTASANQTRTSLVWSSAEAVGNVVLVRMPADASRQHILGVAPKIPKYLKLISREKYDRIRAGEDVDA